MAQLKNTKIDGTLEVTGNLTIGDSSEFSGKINTSISSLKDDIKYLDTSKDVNKPNDDDNIFRINNYFDDSSNLNSNRDSKRKDGNDSHPISFLTMGKDYKVYLAEERYQRRSYGGGLQISTGVNLNPLFVPYAGIGQFGVIKLGKITGNGYYLDNDNNTYKTPLRLDGENAYVSIPKYPSKATEETFGGIKIGYSLNDQNYPIQLDDDGKAYVNVPWLDTNTHYQTKLYVTNSSGTTNKSTTNENTYLRLFDDNTNRSTIKLSGSGATRISSTTNGEIKIQSPNNIKSNNYISTPNGDTWDITEIIKKTLLETVYPVGSIYMSVNNISPANFLGGTWKRWGQGQVPVGVAINEDNTISDSDFDRAGKTGGEKTQSVSGVTAHNHTFTPLGSIISTFTGSLDKSNDANQDHRHWVSGNTVTDGNHYHNGILTTNGNKHSGPVVNLDDQRGDYRWSSNNSNHRGDGCIIANNGSEHSHTLTLLSNGQTVSHHHEYTPKGTVSSTFIGASSSTDLSGNGATVSVLQPYITCYMWKRTA